MSLIYFPDLPPSEWLGKEVVTVYETDIGSNSTFFTDSNGRRWMKRVRNLRKSWNLTLTEPIASNYYPITTGVYIADKKQRLNVIVDRPEGASSMSNGSVEIMVSTTIFSEREIFFFSFFVFDFFIIDSTQPTYFFFNIFTMLSFTFFGRKISCDFNSSSSSVYSLRMFETILIILTFNFFIF